MCSHSCPTSEEWMKKYFHFLTLRLSEAVEGGKKSKGQTNHLFVEEKTEVNFGEWKLSLLGGWQRSKS